MLLKQINNRLILQDFNGAIPKDITLLFLIQIGLPHRNTPQEELSKIILLISKIKIYQFQ
jgi:hypothetical protein